MNLLANLTDLQRDKLNHHLDMMRQFYQTHMIGHTAVYIGRALEVLFEANPQLPWNAYELDRLVTSGELGPDDMPAEINWLTQVMLAIDTEVMLGQTATQLMNAMTQLVPVDPGCSTHAPQPPIDPSMLN